MDHFELGELLSRVTEKSDLYEVVSKYTDLRRKGKVYVGRCPFHDDDAESLTVNVAEKKFYCFGCHAGGSVFKFISMSEGCTLREAVKRQAQNVGVSLFADKKSFESEQIERKRKELIELNEYAQDFYHEILTEKQTGDLCRKYLESRGITTTAVNKFRLGFAPVDDKNITVYLDSYGFSNELALKSGLVVVEENILFDKFQDCIVIPMTENGKVTGFVGQIFNFDKKIFYETDNISARFICLDNNEIFYKRKLIFGFDDAKSAVIESRRVVIVDEPLTAILINDAGIKDVVAILDNIFMPEQAEFLLNYADQMIFCLRDGEQLKFETDTLKTLEYEGVEVFVAALPKNPAEFLRDEGIEKFIRGLNNVQPCKNYKYFTEIQEEVFKDTVLNEAAEKIKAFSFIFDTPKKRWAEEVVLRVCRYNYQLVGYVANVILTDTFSRMHQEIFKYFTLCYDEDQFPDEEGAKKFLNESAYNELTRIVTSDNYRTEVDTNAFDDAVNVLNYKTLSQEYWQLKKTVLENSATSDTKILQLNQITERRSAI